MPDKNTHTISTYTHTCNKTKKGQNEKRFARVERSVSHVLECSLVLCVRQLSCRQWKLTVSRVWDHTSIGCIGRGEGDKSEVTKHNVVRYYDAKLRQELLNRCYNNGSHRVLKQTHPPRVVSIRSVAQWQRACHSQSRPLQWLGKSIEGMRTSH